MRSTVTSELDYISNRDISVVVINSLIFCVLVFSPLRLDGIKYIGCSIFFLVLSGYSFSKRSDFRLFFVALDLPLLGFIGCCFASGFWATNSAVIWEPAFSWLIFILGAIYFRSFLISYKDCFNSGAVFFWLHIALTVLITILVFSSESETGQNWHSYTGYNCNVVLCALVSIYSFVLFCNNKIWIKVLLGLTNVLFILYAGSVGVLLVLVILLLYYLSLYGQNILTVVITTLALIVLGALYFDYNLGLAFVDFEYSWITRRHMMQKSLVLWKEHIVVGIGLDNWRLYETPHSLLTDMGARYHANFELLTNHNMYLNIMAELGTIGIFLFCFPIAIVLYRFIKIIKASSNIEKGSLGSLLVFLVAANYYETASVHYNIFPPTLFMAFLSIGVLTANKEYIKHNLNFFGELFVVSIVLCSFIWNVYSFSTTRKSRIYHSESLKHDFQSKEMLLNLYNPMFNNSFLKKYSLEHKIGKICESQRDYDSAEQYFRKALKNYPNRSNIKIDLASLLIRRNDKLELASALLTSIEDKHRGYNDALPLLVECNIKQSKPYEALEVLDRIELTSENREVLDILSIITLSPEYLGDLFDLSNEETCELVDRWEGIQNLGFTLIDQMRGDSLSRSAMRLEINRFSDKVHYLLIEGFSEDQIDELFRVKLIVRINSVLKSLDRYLHFSTEEKALVKVAVADIEITKEKQRLNDILGKIGIYSELNDKMDIWNMELLNIIGEKRYKNYLEVTNAKRLRVVLTKFCIHEQIPDNSCNEVQSIIIEYFVRNRLNSVQSLQNKKSVKAKKIEMANELSLRQLKVFLTPSQISDLLGLI